MLNGMGMVLAEIPASAHQLVVDISATSRTPSAPFHTGESPGYSINAEARVYKTILLVSCRVLGPASHSGGVSGECRLAIGPGQAICRRDPHALYSGTCVSTVLYSEAWPRCVMIAFIFAELASVRTTQYAGKLGIGPPLELTFLTTATPAC